jgi:hypothetical protein
MFSSFTLPFFFLKKKIKNMTRYIPFMFSISKKDEKDGNKRLNVGLNKKKKIFFFLVTDFFFNFYGPY